MAQFAPGRRIGPYCLLFRLGKGGMGEVWAAKRAGPEGFEKIVALKVMRTEGRSSNTLVMFFDEARAASALHHPSIVPTLDLGRDGEVAFIAMELVVGPSLTALLQRLALANTPLAPAIVAHLGARIASALDYAHDRAVVDGTPLRLIHRDISPHNILLDPAGSVRLMDFGVARTAIQEHESRVGTVRGKPSYMSPEQVRSETLTARSDLFSLGIVLYEAASLRRLFGRGQPVKSMDAVLRHTPTPLVRLVPGFPEPLWDIVRTALQKRPADRQQSAAELRDALEAEAHRLSDPARIERELGALVVASFEPGAFDLGERLAEAREAAEDATRFARVPRPEAPEAEPATRVTELGPSPEDAADAAFSEVLATNVLWPVGSAGDPFDPEALAALQGRAGSVTAPVVTNPALTPAERPLLTSGAGAPSGSGTPSGSGSGSHPSYVTGGQSQGSFSVRQLPRRPPWVLLASVATAVLVAAVATAVLLVRRGPVEVLSPIPIAPSPGLRATPGAVPSAVVAPSGPSAIGAVPPPPSPVEAPPVVPAEAPAPEVAEAPEPSRPAPREVDRRKRPRVEAAPAAPAPTEGEPPAPAEPVEVTPESVMARLRALERRDPARARPLWATFAEAKRSPARLAELDATLRAALAE